MDDQRGEFKRRFAASLLGFRAAKKIRSQAKLAKLVGVSEATVQRWEDLDKPHLPDAWEIWRLCEELGREPADFIRPEELSARELELTRRAARATRRGIGRWRRDS